MKKNVNQFIEVARIDPTKISLQQRQSEFVEIYAPTSKRALQDQAERCLDCGNPYCQWQCPLHNYIPQWLKLAAEGRIIEAAELTHQTNTFPEICGRVCPQERLCEGSCTLESGFGAVAIGNVEKYISDEAFKMGWQPDPVLAKRTGKRVAVIGAGPAGLACAEMLNRAGIAVCVYDRQAYIGGLMTFGIPAFKLEKDILQRRFRHFQEAGIEFCLNVEIGKDLNFAQLEQEFDAIFVAVGAYQSVQEPAIAVASQDVYEALDYLTKINQQVLNNLDPHLDNPIKNKHVVVLGGGDTAMDCIRTSIRLGAASVTGVYRRNPEEMPGSRREYTNACEEGCNFIMNAQANGLSFKNARLSGVKLIKTTNSPGFATSGRSVLAVIPGSEFELAADVVITAFGYTPENLPWLRDSRVAIDNQRRLQVKAPSFQTVNHKIFAGGDVVRGASLVVYAIADGRQAADEIIKFLG